MNEFLSRHKVVLTPLSPIHIGCGEDFEPTNYVIDAEEKLLYSFDLGCLSLSEEMLKELLRLGEQADLLGLHQFFQKHCEHFKHHAQMTIQVSASIGKEYREKIGQVVNRENDGTEVFNRFAIGRHVHNRNMLYIPGSSLKGALRTAILDQINNQKPVNTEEAKDSIKLAERLLEGDFKTSPLRLFKPCDLMALSDLKREILYTVNCYKQPKIIKVRGKETPKSRTGITTRQECILPAQYRSLIGEVVLHDLGGNGTKEGKNRNVPNRFWDIFEISKACNDYYRPRLAEELEIMSKSGLVDPKWKQAIEWFLNDLQIDLEQGLVMLVCLGKFGGAETKTLTNVSAINIPQKHTTLPKSTTYWFAAPTPESEKALIPFGWALVEIDPQEDRPLLKAWCEARASSLDMVARYDAFFKAKYSPPPVPDPTQNTPKVVIEDFIDYFRQRAESLRGKKEKPNGADHQKASALAKQAHENESWTTDDKKAAAAAIEEWLPKVVAVEMKDVRKKLKLAELKGNA
jgi:CRISPR-associated protein Csm5